MVVKRRVIRKMRTFISRATQKITGSLTIDGVVESDWMTEATITNRVTTGMSQAVVKVTNATRRFTDKYTGGEIIEIKADYESGTTVLFKGRLAIPKPMFDRIPMMEITAYDFSYEVADRRVTKKYTSATDIGEIVADLISTYAPNFTSTNVDTSTGITATPMWQDKKLWECIKELVIYYGNNGYEFYCDIDRDWHFYAKGTRRHEVYPLVFGQSISRTVIDVPHVNKKNRIKVIGKNLKGIMIMKTANDIVDQAKTNSWIMEDVIRDTNLTTLAEVKNKASLILAQRKNVGKNGTVTTKSGEINLKAGYQTFIHDQYNGLNGYFNMSEVKHHIKNNLVTTVKFYEYVPTDLNLTEVIQTATTKNQEQLNLDNEHGMDNSYPIGFEDSSSIDSDLSDSNVTTSNGRLVLGYGTVGKMVSVSETATDNVTKGVLKVNGSDYEDSTFRVSTKNGAAGTWETLTPDALHSFTNQGKLIRIEVTLSLTTGRPNPSLSSVGVLYK